MVVGAQAGRAGDARFEYQVARAQRAVQAPGLGSEKNHGLDGRERGEMSRPAVVGDQQAGGVKEHQQFADAAGVAGEVQAGLVADLGAQCAGEFGIVF